jgi:hypothetical protein
MRTASRPFAIALHEAAHSVAPLLQGIGVGDDEARRLLRQRGNVAGACDDANLALLELRHCERRHAVADVDLAAHCLRERRCRIA